MKWHGEMEEEGVVAKEGRGKEWYKAEWKEEVAWMGGTGSGGTYREQGVESRNEGTVDSFL